MRNEDKVLGRCLQHLYEQGVETCLVDHDSTDDTLEIAESFRGRGVFHIERIPFTGEFSLEDQLRHKERLATEIGADWFIHLDADEIREAPPPYKSLHQAIVAVDEAGYNAIDFDEFVFVPASDEESYEGRDFVAGMRWYYYFEPGSPDRYRINAWKNQPEIDLHTHAGHQVIFPGRRVYPQPFILRHYIFLSRAHAHAKYGSRVFAADERARQWHSDRVKLNGGDFSWPSRAALKHLNGSESFDKSSPWRRHFWVSDPILAPNVEVNPDKSTRSMQVRSNGRMLLQEFKVSQGGAIPDIARVSDERRPFWSVMIPTYNPDPSLLCQTLNGLLTQSPGPDDMQIEVVDDASDIDVAAIVADVGQGRIGFHRQPENIGMARNWNECLQRAKGEWVHLLHQDDLPLVGFYRQMRSPCETIPDLVAAFCRGTGIDGRGQKVWVQEPERQTAGVLQQFTKRLAIEQRILTPCIVVHRRAYEAIGGYHQGLPYCADWDMYKRLAVLGPIWYEPANLACWRQHDKSTSARLRLDGSDLADRRRSVELSSAYLPTYIEETTSIAALKGSMIWAVDILRDSLLADDFATALAQSREIVIAIEQVLRTQSSSTTLTDPAPLGILSAAETRALWAQIDEFNSQLQAWKRAAQILAKINPDRPMNA
ncbi:MAG: glycosyltransferase [Caldilineales bacterium]|nr:glycosyltransferase [Caldilineales bacterium]